MARYKDVDGYRKLFDEEYKKTRKLISEGETHLDNLAEGFSEASRVIDRMPTADVVEVVRCKDCKHRGTDDCPMYHEEYIEWDDDGCLERDIIIHDATEDNSFCSHGERKSDENKC